MEGDGRVREYVGGYADWVRQRQAEESSKARVSRQELRKANVPQKRRMTFKEKQELESLLKEQDNLPGMFEKLENEQKQLEELLTDADLYTRDPEKFYRVTLRLPEIEEEQLSLLERSEFIGQRIAELQALA